MKSIFPLLISISLFLTNCSNDNHQIRQSAENERDWIVLFDGTDTGQWRGYNAQSFPETGWSIEGKALVFDPENSDGTEGGSNIITKKKFENFHLQLEWRIEEGSNSGIFYGVLEQAGIDIYWSGPEYQIIDPEIFSEMNEETEKRVSGALYDLVKPDPMSMNPVGEWNRSEIIVDGAVLIHRLNGRTVVETKRWTPEWFEWIRNSKFASHNEFGNVRNGHIGIQDHGGPVMFRNIRVRRL